MDKGTQEQQVRVLDCQPFQKSLLDALADQPTESLTTPSGATADLIPIQTVAIPAIAQPYLALRGKLHQALPAIHDAWQQEGHHLVLLEDRSDLPLLLDIWMDEQAYLPPLQLLHWLYEMVELWGALEPWCCQQSLLDMANLRVDEDQALCLQRLHTNATDAPAPSLNDLGTLWQTLFTRSQRTQLGSIPLLLADLDGGQVTTIDQLRSRIETIANELQATQLDVDMRSDFPAPEPTNSPILDLTALDYNPAAPDATDLSASLASTRLDPPLAELTALVDDDGESENDDMPTVVLPMQLFSLEDTGRTDIGRQRDHNEDYFGIETLVGKLESPSGKTVNVRNLYILCDGMGGHAGGEVASALAVDTLRRYFKDKWQRLPFSDGVASKLPGPDILIDAVQLANKAIYDVNQQNARFGSGRMGTTLVMVLIQDTDVAVAHVGDSRLYRYTRKRGLEQITTDHEVGQREIQRGVEAEIAYARPDAYQLTQALGPRDEHFIKPDVQYLELTEDALLLICSDGLTDNDLIETHWRTHLEPLLSSQSNLEQGVSKLIELANQYNGHDNITAIAIRAKVRPNLEHLK
jgi:protein phosphatase